jgi:hypothetical protein
VREAHVWVSRAWGYQDPAFAKKADIVVTTERPKDEETPPATLNWDLWIGAAPYRPFNNVYVPGPKWYRWWDFGNGTMSDLGSHWNDLPFWALDLEAPLAISADGPPPHPEIAPASMSATYEYGQRGDKPPVKLTWHQGTSKPQIWTDGGIPKWSDGCLFIGDKGMLLANYGKYLLLPQDQFKDFKLPAQTLPRIAGRHHVEWIEGCKAGKQTSANFQYSGLLTEANHLGNVAYRLGKRIEWDTKAMKATNAPEADRLIRCPRRKGWDL